VAKVDDRTNREPLGVITIATQWTPRHEIDENAVHDDGVASDVHVVPPSLVTYKLVWCAGVWNEMMQ
jgi:hypothetical protein